MTGENDPKTNQGADSNVPPKIPDSNLRLLRIASSQPVLDQSTTDADHDANSKKERLIDVLAARTQKNLDEEAKKLLNNLSCKKDQNGTLTVFRDNSNVPVMSLHSGGATANWDPDQPDGSKDHIDNILQTVAAVKAINPPGWPVVAAGDNEISNLMVAKAIELEGMKVANKPEKSLDLVNPALARKMEEEWVKMGGTVPAKTEKYDNKQQVTGLVTTPSPLDSTPKGALAAAFGPAAAGNVPSPPSTPGAVLVTPTRVTAPDNAFS